MADNVPAPNARPNSETATVGAPHGEDAGSGPPAENHHVVSEEESVAVALLQSELAETAYRLEEERTTTNTLLGERDLKSRELDKANTSLLALQLKVEKNKSKYKEEKAKIRAKGEKKLKETRAELKAKAKVDLEAVSSAPAPTSAKAIKTAADLNELKEASASSLPSSSLWRVSTANV